MMITTEELENRLAEIDLRLFLLKTDDGRPSSIYWGESIRRDTLLYDFGIKGYGVQGFIEENCLKQIPDKIHDLNKLLDEYYEGRNEILARDSEDKGHTAKEMGETARKIAENWKKFDTRIAGSLSEENPFKEYTDKLAQTLSEKNSAYGDSFTKSVDTYGLSVIGVRLSDKYNRIEHLITHHELKENDESLEDTLLDMAGYAILGLKYLEEHKDEEQRAS